MSLGIGDLDIGVSAGGMSAYGDLLHTEVFESTKQLLDTEVEAIEAKLAEGWQGESFDRYKEKLEAQVETMKGELDAENADLQNRLTELESYYFNQDKNLIMD